MASSKEINSLRIFSNLYRLGQSDLISTVGFGAKKLNSNLINPTGLIIDEEGIIWTIAAGTGLLLAFNSNLQEKFNIPIMSGLGTKATPMGICLNKSPHFSITSLDGKKTLPAKFIIVTFEGDILGYHPDIENFKNVADHSSRYVAITILHDHFYAVNLTQKRIEKYDTNWKLVTSFTDSSLTTINYSPFGIVASKNNLYISYVKVEDEEFPIGGIGNGYINYFSASGELIKRFANRGYLNSPRSLIIYQNLLLVGNYSDGIIQIFDRESGQLKNSIKLFGGGKFRIENLWNIYFDSRNKILYLVAGIENQTHGLLTCLK